MLQEFAIIASAALFTGGVIKGYSGMGLPMIAIPALSLFYPIEEALTLLIVPIFLTNAIQAKEISIDIFKSYWLKLLATSLIAGTIASYLIIRHSSYFLLIASGISMVIFALVSLAGIKIRIPSSKRNSIAVTVGSFAGLIGGVNSLYGWPLVMLLSKSGLKPAQFIAAISTLYLIGHTCFVISLTLQGHVNINSLITSMLACIPVLIGMKLGTHIRVYFLNPSLFFNMVHVLILLGGSSLLLKSI